MTLTRKKRKTLPGYVDTEAMDLFKQLKELHGSFQAAASAAGLPRKTFTDWMQRGLNSPEKWTRAKLVLRNALNQA